MEGETTSEPARRVRLADVDRERAAIHLTLGAGHHIRIGQMIARVEAEAILGDLVWRVDRLEPTGDPVYRLANTLHTFLVPCAGGCVENRTH